jgi:Fe-S-cluster-containing dehydrogenase component
VKKWNMIIDVEKCEDCNNCFLSCKDEYVDNDFPPYSVAQPRHGQRWINIMRKERGQFPLVDVAYLPIPCMHCDDAPCIRKARDGAVYKTNSGAVIIDPEKARGQKDIPSTCPYGAIWWSEERNVAQKCTLCAHLLEEGWKEPRCVQSCPTGAMRWVRAEDAAMARIVTDEGLEVLHPEYKTRPRVYYKNLHRFFRCFIGGNVAIDAGGVIDCAEGATVTLFKGSQKIGEVKTDNYGDFKFDNLEENGGRYKIEVAFEGREKNTVEVDLSASINIGTILLR